MRSKGCNCWQAVLLIAFALITVGTDSAHARTGTQEAVWQPVWKIGTFDQSSAEFQGGVAADPAEPYVVGKSRPAQNWFAFQPGSGNGQFGHKPHPVSIEFNLAEKPAASTK